MPIDDILRSDQGDPGWWSRVRDEVDTFDGTGDIIEVDGVNDLTSEINATNAIDDTDSAGGDGCSGPGMEPGQGQEAYG